MLHQAGWRLPGQEIEQVIAHAASEILSDDGAISTALHEAGIATHHIPAALNKAKKIQQNTANLIDRFIRRVDLRQDGIRLTLSLASLLFPEVDLTIIRDIPMRMKRRGIEMRLIIHGTGPIRLDQTLLKTIVRAHKWFNDLAIGRMQNMDEIASRKGVDKSYVSRVVNLAFPAPDIIESIVAGHQPADLNVEKLTKRTDLPLDWAQ
jgi:site-specific DNA recombinase